MVRAERGAKPVELRQTLDEIEILSGEIDELWRRGGAVGFVRTLNLAGVPLSGVIDCFAVNVFR